MSRESMKIERENVLQIEMKKEEKRKKDAEKKKEIMNNFSDIDLTELEPFVPLTAPLDDFMDVIRYEEQKKMEKHPLTKPKKA